MAEDSTQPPHATRFIETSRGILSYAQLAPLLAERVLKVQQDIEDEIFAGRALDESLLLDFHRGICGDLTPNWAGRFRDADVRVGGGGNATFADGHVLWHHDRQWNSNSFTPFPSL